MEKTTFFSPLRALAAILKLFWGENPDFSTQLNNNIHSPRKIRRKIASQDYTERLHNCWSEMANILPPFPPFSVHEDDASVGPRWKKWLKRFEMYLAAHEVKDPTRKRALLLYSAGEEVASLESSIIILNSFNGNFYFTNPARNNNPVRILVMQYKTLQQSLL